MKVWILAQVGYDEYTLIGVYSTQEIAEGERTRCEALQEAHPGVPRSSRREVRDSLDIREVDVDRSGIEVIVRTRNDGNVAETHIALGYASVHHAYERLWEGRAGTYEEALAIAERERTKDVLQTARSTAQESTNG